MELHRLILFKKRPKIDKRISGSTSVRATDILI